MAVDERVEVSARTKLRRFPVRGKFDRVTINSILDSAPLAHIAFETDSPAILPMVFWRNGDFVYFHGSSQNRMFGALAEGSPCCFAVTILDGFVAARAAIHHSVNYRSVIVYGDAEDVKDADEKMEALQGLIERFYPGRWSQVRPPSAEEFAMVRVFKLPIQEASAKVRSGFPTPYAEDFGIPVWAGVVPLHVGLGAPLIDPHCDPDTPPWDLEPLSRMFAPLSSDAG